MDMDIREVITRPEYDFLRTNPRLGNNIMFLTFGGSHSYGTNTEGSDIDLRGCAFPHKENTTLPDKPDYAKIEEFVMEVNKSVVLGE